MKPKARKYQIIPAVGTCLLLGGAFLIAAPERAAIRELDRALSRTMPEYIYHERYGWYLPLSDIYNGLARIERCERFWSPFSRGTVLDRIDRIIHRGEFNEGLAEARSMRNAVVGIWPPGDTYENHKPKYALKILETVDRISRCHGLEGRIDSRFIETAMAEYDALCVVKYDAVTYRIVHRREKDVRVTASFLFDNPPREPKYSYKYDTIKVECGYRVMPVRDVFAFRPEHRYADILSEEMRTLQSATTVYKIEKGLVDVLITKGMDAAVRHVYPEIYSTMTESEREATYTIFRWCIKESCGVGSATDEDFARATICLGTAPSSEQELAEALILLYRSGQSGRVTDVDEALRGVLREATKEMSGTDDGLESDLEQSMRRYLNTSNQLP